MLGLGGGERVTLGGVLLSSSTDWAIFLDDSAMVSANFERLDSLSMVVSMAVTEVWSVVVTLVALSSSVWSAVAALVTFRVSAAWVSDVDLMKLADVSICFVAVSIETAILSEILLNNEFAKFSSNSSRSMNATALTADLASLEIDLSSRLIAKRIFANFSRENCSEASSQLCSSRYLRAVTTSLTGHASFCTCVSRSVLLGKDLLVPLGVPPPRVVLPELLFFAVGFAIGDELLWEGDVVGKKMREYV